MLKYCRVNGCPWNEETCKTAAEYGHFDIFQWAHENGCPWHEATCEFAAKHGHLDILKYARANGCPWDGEVIFEAAKYGHLNVVQWAYENKCPIYLMDTCRIAAANNHYHVLQWLCQHVSNHYDSPINHDEIMNLCLITKINHFNALIWLKEHFGYVYNERAEKIIASLTTDLLNVLEYQDLVKLIKLYI